MIKVGINGYGTIGKRVAEAVTLQDDMEIVGIVKTKPTYEIRGALDAGFPVYASTKSKISFFEDKGVKVAGVTEDLVDISDVIIDCTPGKLGVNNMEMYQKAGKGYMARRGKARSNWRKFQCLNKLFFFY